MICIGCTYAKDIREEWCFCDHYNAPIHCTFATCEHWKSRKEKTNGDRIRSMTDEELAEFIYKLDNCEDSINWWIDWLKQEVEE